MHFGHLSSSTHRTSCGGLEEAIYLSVLRRSPALQALPFPQDSFRESKSELPLLLGKNAPSLIKLTESNVKIMLFVSGKFWGFFGFNEDQ